LIVEASPDVLSADLFAGDSSVYREVTGYDNFERAWSTVNTLLESRAATNTDERGGNGPLWIVPRITRRDEVYEHIESFYDRWVMLAGACVIDQLGSPLPDARIEPLGKPRLTSRRDWRSRLWIDAQGRVLADEAARGADGAIGSLAETDLATLWSRLMRRRLDAWRTHGDDHPDLRTLW
ncbi:MAG TPA: hypothetical protein VG797_08060, partial [Phycisphaerales bacterium]|nr:hypothetical protein [Phycisphaerales bacterium]